MMDPAVFLEQLKTTFLSWLHNLANIDLMVPLIFLTALVFLVLHTLRQFLIFRYLSIAVSFIPVLVHELGHALAATLTGGRVRNIHMVLTGWGQKRIGAQGYAETEPRGRLSGAIIAFMGYVMPPLMLFTGIWLIQKELSIFLIVILVFFMVYYLVKTRQKYIPLLILAILLYSGYDLTFHVENMTHQTMNIGVNLILGLLLGETVQSILTTTKIMFGRSNTSDWDGAAMSRYLGVPQIGWWLIWTFISVYFIVKSMFILI